MKEIYVPFLFFVFFLGLLKRVLVLSSVNQHLGVKQYLQWCTKIHTVNQR